MEADQPVKRCGSCFWGKMYAPDMTKRICRGGPPGFVAQGVNPKTGQIIGINGYPIVNATDEQCGAYKARLILDTGVDKT